MVRRRERCCCSRFKVSLHYDRAHPKRRRVECLYGLRRSEDTALDLVVVIVRLYVLFVGMDIVALVPYSMPVPSTHSTSSKSLEQ
jgi:hypothetical protein